MEDRIARGLVGKGSGLGQLGPQGPRGHPRADQEVQPDRQGVARLPGGTRIGSSLSKMVHVRGAVAFIELRAAHGVVCFRESQAVARRLSVHQGQGGLRVDGRVEQADGAACAGLFQAEDARPSGDPPITGRQGQLERLFGAPGRLGVAPGELEGSTEAEDQVRAPGAGPRGHPSRLLEQPYRGGTFAALDRPPARRRQVVTRAPTDRLRLVIPLTQLDPILIRSSEVVSEDLVVLAHPLAGDQFEPVGESPMEIRSLSLREGLVGRIA